MVRHGVGIAMLPEDIARRYIGALGLELVQIADAWARRQFYACMREPEAGDSHAANLLGHLCGAGSTGNATPA